MLNKTKLSLAVFSAIVSAAPLMAAADMHSAEPTGLTDDTANHGTGMAGLAAYGDGATARRAPGHGQRQPIGRAGGDRGGMTERRCAAAVGERIVGRLRPARAHRPPRRRE